MSCISSSLKLRSAFRKWMLLAVFASAGPLYGATLTVTSTADSGAGSLRDTIAAAAAGDTINFSVTGTIALSSLSGHLLVDKDLTITGPGAGNLTISGGNAVRVFWITANVSMSGLTISDGRARDAGGWASSGGGILSSGNLTLTNVVVQNCVAGNAYDRNSTLAGLQGGSGGGILCTASLTLNDCTVSGNYAGHGGNGNPGGKGGDGGGICGVDVTLNRTVVSGNYAGWGSVRYSGSSDAGAGGDGGGIHATGHLTINDCAVTGNRSGLSPTQLPSNSGGNGAGIYTSGTGTFAMQRTEVASNLCYWGGSNTSTSYSYAGGQGGSGGGIYYGNSTSGTAIDCSIHDNTAGTGGTGGKGGTGGYGGGIYQAAGTLSVTRSVLYANGAGTSGRSINTSGFGMAYGGSGGGVAVQSGATCALANVTVSGNSAGNAYDITSYGTGGYGGGIYSEGTLSLVSCTVAGNTTGNRPTKSGTNGSVGRGGGIRVQSGTASLTSAIVALNLRADATDDDVYGTLDGASSYNLVGVDTLLAGISNGTNNNQVGTAASPLDPVLDALADNGGPAIGVPGATLQLLTRALLGGSPAVDRGSGGGLTVDQRGFSRPADFPSITNADDGADIGAYEARGIGISDVVLAEGNSGTTTFTFTVARTDSAGEASVNYATADNTALDGTDYTGTSGPLAFANGEASKTVTVSVATDAVVELDKTFFVNLSNPVGTVLFDAQGLGTIVNDDFAQFSIDDVTLNEGDAGTSTFTFTVTLDTAVDRSVDVSFAAANGSARTADGDYAATSGVLNFAGTAGETKTVSVTVNGDTKVEPNETFYVNLSNIQAGGRAVTFADNQGLGTITNDDSATLSIDDVTLAEGDAPGTTTFTFTVTLDSTVDVPVLVDCDTADDTATLADNDYAAAYARLAFAPFQPPGQTRTFGVTVNGDGKVELDQRFFVNLSNVQAGGRDVTIADGQGDGTILNDDDAALSIDDVVLSEGDAGPTAFTFTVTLDNDVDAAFTVDYASADGTAKAADSDFAPALGQLTFAGTAGETQTATVDVTGDVRVELDETFLVNLSNIQAGGRNLSFSDGQGSGTILNDDSATLSIGDLSAYETNAGLTPFDFTLTLDHPVDTPVLMAFTVFSGTARFADGDLGTASGTAVLEPDATTQTLTVLIPGDTLVEADETFDVELTFFIGSGRDVSLGDTTGTGTILNDDTTELSIDDVTLAEGDSGSQNFVFTVTLSQSSQLPVTVDFETADGTALAGEDYTYTNGQLTFAPFALTRTLAVPVLGDTPVEPDEVFTVVITNPSPAAAILGDDTGDGTILNDDAPPVAADDAATVDEGQSVHFGITGNDTDADTAVDPSSVNILTGVSHGSLQVNADGTVDYTHDGSENFSDSFTYTVDDTDGSTSNVATVTITITPVNDQPVAGILGSDPFYIVENEPLPLEGTGSDAEPGDLTYNWNWDDGSPNGTAQNPSHAWDAPGTYTVTLVVTDQDGLSSSAVTVQVVVTPKAGERDLFLKKGKFAIDWKAHAGGIDKDTFFVQGCLNPAGCNAMLTGATFELGVNGVSLGTVPLAGTGKGSADNAKVSLRAKTGAFSFSVKAADLRAALGLSNTTEAGNVDLMVEITVPGAGLDTEAFAAHATFAYTTTQDAASKGAFNYKLNASSDGYFVAVKTSVAEDKAGAHKVSAKGYVEAPGGASLVPDGDVTLTIGTQAITIPATSLTVAGGVIALNKGAHPDLAKFVLDTNKKQFSILTAALSGTGVPPAGNPATSHDLLLRVTVPTAGDTIVLETTVEILRSSPTSTKWKR